MVRRRFQRGSLFKRGKREKVWVARWWEDVINADGTMGRMRRSIGNRYRRRTNHTPSRYACSLRAASFIE